MKKLKKILAVLLAILMISTLLPMEIFASEECSHENTSEITVEATCTKAAKSVVVCTDCEAELDSVETGAAIGHVYGEPVWTWSEDGKSAEAKFTCTVCTDEENHEVTYTAVVSSEVAKAPTCTQLGDTKYTAVVTIPETADSYTAESYTDTKTVEGDIAVLNHVYGEPVWTWSEDGKSAAAKFSCTACTDEENHEVTYTAVVSSEVAKAPTCTQPGDTKYTAVVTIPETEDAYTAENYTDTKTVEGDIAVNNHVYGEPVWTWSEDGKSAEAKFTCTVCEDEENHEVTYTAVVDDGNMVAEPTCAVMGDTEYTGVITIPESADAYTAESYTEKTIRTDIPVKGHIYDEPVWKWTSDGKAATLTFTCTVCEDDDNHIITVDATVHSNVYVKQTCTFMGTTGYMGTYTVPESVDKYTAESYTAKTYRTDIPADGHTYGEPTWKWSRKNTVATITFECVACEDEENHERVFSGIVREPVVVLDSTCTMMGKTEYAADFDAPVSEDTYTQSSYELVTVLEDVQMKPHKKIITIEPIVATCTEGGRTAQSECTECGRIINASVATEPKEHSVYEQVKAVVPTCTKDGRTATLVCRNCGETVQVTEVLKATGHAYVVDEVKQATCTEAGYTLHRCTKCGDTYKDNFVDAKGHAYKHVDGVKPTCTTKGFDKYICDVCGDEYINSNIPATGHKYVIHPAKDPTCLEDGNEEYVTCTKCDYTNITVLPKIPHTDNNSDGKCDMCSLVLNCGHVCHQNNIIGHIIRFFYSLFGKKCCDDMVKLF